MSPIRIQIKFILDWKYFPYHQAVSTTDILRVSLFCPNYRYAQKTQISLDPEKYRCVGGTKRFHLGFHNHNILYSSGTWQFKESICQSPKWTTHLVLLKSSRRQWFKYWTIIILENRHDFNWVTNLAYCGTLKNSVIMALTIQLLRWFYLQIMRFHEIQISNQFTTIVFHENSLRWTVVEATETEFT